MVREPGLTSLRDLQNAGVPTYGMMCPVFPQVVDSDELERLIESIRPDRCEHVWAEPFNDRQNWKHVRKYWKPGSPMWDWMNRVYRDHETAVWSRYATELYTSIRQQAVSDGWLHKFRYLLYESDITAEDALSFQGLQDVLLQSKPALDGRSCNPAFAALQQ